MKLNRLETHANCTVFLRHFLFEDVRRQAHFSSSETSCLDRKKQPLILTNPIPAETGNYEYLKAFQLALKFSHKPKTLKKFPSHKDPTSFSGLLCRVPLGVFNFSLNRDFIDDDSFRRWLDIMNEGISKNKIRNGQIRTALVGLCKINESSNGRTLEKLGWDMFGHWLNLILCGENEPLCRVRTLNTVACLLYRSIYRGGKNVPTEYCQSIIRKMNGEFESICSVGLKLLTDRSLRKREYNIVAHDLLEALHTWNFNLKQSISSEKLFSSLKSWINDDANFEFFFNDVDKRNVILSGTLSDLPKDQRQARVLFLLAILRRATLMYMWSIDNEKFWKYWTKFTCDNLLRSEKFFSPRFASNWLQVCLLILLRAHSDKRYFWNGKAEYKRLLLRVIKPLVLDNAEKFVPCMKKVGVEHLQNLLFVDHTESNELLSVEEFTLLKNSILSYLEPKVVRIKSET